MINSVNIRPTAFTGGAQQNSRNTPVKAALEVLENIFELTDNDIDSSSLSMQHGEFHYDIKLKDGREIQTNGFHFLEIRNEIHRLNQNQGFIFKKDFELSFDPTSTMNGTLRTQLKKAIEHLGEIWIKLPDEPSKVIPLKSAVKPASFWRGGFLEKFLRRCLLISS